MTSSTLKHVIFQCDVFSHNLFERQDYREGSTSRESKKENCSMSWFSPLDGCKWEGWVRPKPEARNLIWAFHVGAGAQGLFPISARSWTGSGTSGK